MSILISGVQMPKSCNECPCCCYSYYEDCGDVWICQLLDTDIGGYGFSNVERYSDCPLVEVPDTYEIKTRSFTDEERKVYLEALKKGVVKKGNRLYSADEGGE